METTSLKDKTFKYGSLPHVFLVHVRSAVCTTIGAGDVEILTIGICVTNTTVNTSTVAPAVVHRSSGHKTLSSVHTGEQNTNSECSLLHAHTFCT